MSDPIDERNVQIVQLAYDGSAESFFIRRLGIVLVDEARTPAEQALASRILSRLVEPSTPPELSPEAKQRLRAMRGLLISTMAARQSPEKYEDLSETKH